MQKRWIILFVALLSISFLGLFYSGHEGMFTDIDSNLNFADIAWMITATIFVLMMTPGLSFFYGGMVRSKNVISTMLQSFIAMGVISVIWVVVGFSLAFGEDVGHFIGNPGTFFMFVNVGGATDKLLAPTIPLALYALFQMKFAHYYSVIDNRLICRTCSFFWLSGIYDFVLYICVLSFGSLDLASRWFSSSNGGS